MASGAGAEERGAEVGADGRWMGKIWARRRRRDICPVREGAECMLVFRGRYGPLYLFAYRIAIS